ncbi:MULTISPECIES: hypothetical protein [unclassified Schlesneria]|uniref:hypothetical protein n=1 Tax=unclassified Schlesneria TaxID=2762017 RepID=UPI002EFF1C83
MARAAKLAIVFASVVGFSLASPVESQAGVIPWMYDAIFGPVGSIRANSTYAPAAVGYAPYSAYQASYTPMTVAYAPIDGSYGSVAEPMYTSYAPAYSYSGVTTAGYRSLDSGCACNQSTSYVPSSTYGAAYGYGPSYYGSTGCSSCSGGNCSSGNCGVGCSNCNVGPGSTTAGYGSTSTTGPIPEPDPNNTGRDDRSKIYELERRLDELDQRQRYDERYFRRQHQDYSPNTPNSNRDAREEEEVKARRKQSTFGSDSDSDPSKYPPPVKRSPAPADDQEPEERFKPSLDVPPTNEKPATEADGTTQVKETEPQALNMETRITAKAVTPKVRLQIRTKQGATSVAKSVKPSVKTSVNPVPVTVAKQ